jgi:hypothetical protein
VARPTYTARRREALLIERNADGMLEIGNGRIRIAPGTVPYFRHVAADLGLVLDAPGGAEAFDRGDALGHTVTIVQPDVPTVPPNGWTLPDDIRAATAAGVPVSQVDANGVMLTGTGTGCGCKIFYDPDDWPLRGDPSSPASHEVLLRLLLHANACAEGTNQPPMPPAPAGAPQTQLRLRCRPGKVGNALSFPYVVENPGPGAVYVMDAVACADPATRAACAGERAAVVINAAGDAIVGTFVPPMPMDRQIAVPVIPLARRLEAGGILEHRLDIAAPYAETSLWLPDLPLRSDSAVDIKGVVLAVGYWTADMAGLDATEAAYAPGLYAIAPPRGGAIVSVRFPTTGLQFSRRIDASPRASA